MTPWIVALLPALIFAGYYRFLETGVHPWNTYKAWEETVRYPINFRSYFESFGPVFIVFLFAVPVLLRRGGIWLLHISWAFSGWMMIFGMNRWIPLSNIRFVEGYQYIPVAIAASYAVWQIAIKLGRGRKIAERVFIGFAIVAVSLYALVGFRASMREHVQYLQNDILNPAVFVPAVKFEAFEFIDTHTPDDSVVMAPYSWSTMIPAFTGNRVVGGHRLFTVDYEKKLADIAFFYSTNDLDILRTIMRKHGVAYVISDSVSIGLVNLEEEGSIQTIWTKRAATIYKVIGE